ncbi:glyoxalase [Paraburkholderia dipogonis]|uniref:Glyoxalase n=1 Tax=Paraburkholderia dipogonis TaxID=1211383 RepID=A0A4Y8MX48_9BURK|nr:VOC family protein [Paraburkholderia dipogonis]TFE42014.1 glyoxalase [Paraburkholderia dipogonis]
MPVTKLAHYSIRTTDLDKSRRFYTQVLGFREGFRPPFNFPGIWLYNGSDESEFGVVHIIGIAPNDPNGLVEYLGDKALPETGTGTVDHIAFLATGLQDLWATLRREGYEWRDRTVPSLGLHQVFVEDPSGVTIEMNFSAHEVPAPQHTAPAHTEV